VIRRVRGADWLAAAGGVGLLAAMFLSWYSGMSAWQALSVLDVVLALLAPVPLALVVLQATRTSPSLPVAFSVLTTVAGALATLLILYRIVNQPGPNDVVDVEIGAWAGLAAGAVMAAGGWRSTRAEAIPGARTPPIEDLPAPAA
jgi:drug/metabolite transporter (DMT)-like permease